MGDRQPHRPQEMARHLTLNFNVQPAFDVSASRTDSSRGKDALRRGERSTFTPNGQPGVSEIECWELDVGRFSL